MDEFTIRFDANIPLMESNSDSSDFICQGNKNDELNWVENEVVVIESTSESNLVDSNRNSQDVLDTVCTTKTAIPRNDCYKSDKLIEHFVRESQETDHNFVRKWYEKVEEYFTGCDSNHVMCNLCSTLFSVKNDFTELINHLCDVHRLSLKSSDQTAESTSINNKHIMNVVCPEAPNIEKDEDIIDISKNISSKINYGYDRVDMKRSIWDYLTKLSSGHTKCNLCDEILQYDVINKSNFIHHLNTGHIYDFVELSVCENDTPILEEDETLNKQEAEDNKMANRIWKYYSKTPLPDQLKCNYCNHTLKYTEGVTSNLTEHLKLIHESVYNNSEDFTSKFNLLVSEINDCNIDDQAIILELDDEDMSNVVSEINKNSDKHIAIIADVGNDNLLDMKGLLKTKASASKLSRKNFIEDLKISEVFSLKEIRENRVIGNNNVSREKANPQSVMKKQKLSALDYFTKLKTKDNTLKCNFCSEVMIYNKTSSRNLLQHLMGTHGVMFPKQFKVQKLLNESNSLCKSVEYELPNELSVSDISLMNLSTTSNYLNDISDNSLSKMNSARLKSNENSSKNKLWLYFKKLYRDKAKCNICNKPLTYKLGQTSNLIKHLKIKHNFLFNKSNAGSSKLVSESVEANHNDEKCKAFIGKRLNQTKMIWDFFSKLDNCSVECNLCPNIKVLHYSNRSKSNLIRHLKQKHKYFLDFKFKGDYSSRNYNRDTHTTSKSINRNEVSNKDNTNDLDIDIKMLFDVFVNDEVLSRCIVYEREQIICKLCSGTFLCDDIINYEYTIRYHVQLCHSDSPLLLPDSEMSNTNNSDYNELEAVANEINSFMK